MKFSWVLAVAITGCGGAGGIRIEPAEGGRRVGVEKHEASAEGNSVLEAATADTSARDVGLDSNVGPETEPLDAAVSCSSSAECIPCCEAEYSGAGSVAVSEIHRCICYSGSPCSEYCAGFPAEGDAGACEALMKSAVKPWDGGASINVGPCYDSLESACASYSDCTAFMSCISACH